jgi:hypothetical protein
MEKNEQAYHPAAVKLDCCSHSYSHHAKRRGPRNTSPINGEKITDERSFLRDGRLLAVKA